MAKMNMTSLDVLTDEVFGKVGTSKRDAMEKQLKEATRKPANSWSHFFN